MDNSVIFDRSKAVWEQNLKQFPATRLQYPAEALVRLLSGRYIDVPQPPARLLDHGFGHANNLAYALQRGYTCSGCEISTALIDTARENLPNTDNLVSLDPITGLDLPYPSGEFDIILSWDVLHYCGTRADVARTISDFHRLLKRGGILLLSTIHPQNAVFRRLQPAGDGSFVVASESIYDNRRGLTLFVSQSDKELAVLFRAFRSVRTGYLHHNLFNTEKEHAAYLVYARK